MNLSKAIEILKYINDTQTSAKTADSITAISIGSDAIQRIIHARSFNLYWAIMPLSHETEE